MVYHKILTRQLAHLGLTESTLPDLAQWKEFLGRVNTHYNDADQDLYLLERSMKISSEELMELNTKLAESQKLAKLGYWYHDIKTGQNTWSPEVYKMFNRDVTLPALSLKHVMSLVHPEEYNHISELVNNALTKGEGYEAELRLKIVEGPDPYRWYRVIGKPIKGTDGLTSTLQGVVIDITESKKAQKEMELLNQQVVTSARRAGMADVATSVLHNIGNVLNSVNVSISLVREAITNESYEKLNLIIEMIKTHINDLPKFFTEDERGKNIPSYLSNLIVDINATNSELSKEINELDKQISHIKDIADLQKVIGGVTGVVEKIYLPEAIDTAIKMCDLRSKAQTIKINKVRIDNMFLDADKSKLLQILVNLIQNAKDALMEAPTPDKTITLVVNKIDDKHLEIRCEDNGIGIDKKDLITIFSFGFTTKENGHGFGLHSSALAAKELGGSLEVVSKGKNQGAAFILTLPIRSPERSVSHGRPRKEEHADYSH